MTSPVETAIRGLVTPALMGVASLNRAMRRSKGPNPYLTGVHTPLKEENTITDLKVTGTIPAGLNGLYLRNGPNPLKMPNPATHHWFVGDAMLHGIRIQDGKAPWYRNRWIRSTPVSEALHEAPVPHQGLGRHHSRPRGVDGSARQPHIWLVAGVLHWLGPWRNRRHRRRFPAVVAAAFPAAAIDRRTP